MNNNFPKHMHAVILTGHGGFDKLKYKKNISVPIPKDDELLIRVKGSGINNTDINTRIGWYSKSLTAASNQGNFEGIAETKDR